MSANPLRGLGSKLNKLGEGAKKHAGKFAAPALVVGAIVSAAALYEDKLEKKAGPPSSADARRLLDEHKKRTDEELARLKERLAKKKKTPGELIDEKLGRTPQDPELAKKEAEASEFQGELERLHVRLGQLEKENDAKDRTIQALQNQKTELNSKIEKQQAIIEAAKAEKSAVAEAKRALNQMRDKAAGLEVQLDLEKAAAGKLKAELAQVKGELEKTKTVPKGEPKVETQPKPIPKIIKPQVAPVPESDLRAIKPPDIPKLVTKPEVSPRSMDGKDESGWVVIEETLDGPGVKSKPPESASSGWVVTDEPLDGPRPKGKSSKDSPRAR